MFYTIYVYILAKIYKKIFKNSKINIYIFLFYLRFSLDAVSWALIMTQTEVNNKRAKIFIIL